MSGETGPVIASGPPFSNQSDGSVSLRQEIRDLHQNKKLWTLYLLGLQALQNVDTDAPMSYYQIAGIHGTPHVKWPDRDWNSMSQVDGSQSGGFCTHNSILFLPWHRPYLALFEQAIFAQVGSIAQKLAHELNDNSWTTEAQNFRLPYWDWADPHKGTYPDEALNENVSIIQPGTNGQEKQMKNPLYNFQFASSDQDGNVNNAGETWRIAVDADPNAVGSQLVAEFKRSFQEEAQQYQEKNLTERVLYILQGYSKYATMSNDAFRGRGKPGTYGSLEGIHNTIHNVTGGGGNMSDPDVAAFDPIFWLHHW
jgi:tyrosinase